jgi:UDP-N-acetylglucosamine 2-epimerase (non-hydrolysing)
MNEERILQAVELLKNQKRGEERSLNIVSEYSIDNVSEKVVRIILSYTDYIKRVVWAEDCL